MTKRKLRRRLAEEIQAVDNARYLVGVYKKALARQIVQNNLLTHAAERATGFDSERDLVGFYDLVGDEGQEGYVEPTYRLS